MWINPVLAGVLITLTVEVALIAVIAIAGAIKIKRDRRGK